MGVDKCGLVVVLVDMLLETHNQKYCHLYNTASTCLFLEREEQSLPLLPALVQLPKTGKLIVAYNVGHGWVTSLWSKSSFAKCYKRVWNFLNDSRSLWDRNSVCVTKL